MLQICGLVEEGSEGLNGSRWDELFVAINATSDEADQFNHKKGLNRQEFLDFIVRAAVMRHCHLAVAEDVPKAVHTLITVDMLPRIKIFDPLALEPMGSEIVCLEFRLKHATGRARRALKMSSESDGTNAIPMDVAEY